MLRPFCFVFPARLPSFVSMWWLCWSCFVLLFSFFGEHVAFLMWCYLSLLLCQRFCFRFGLLLSGFWSDSHQILILPYLSHRSSLYDLALAAGAYFLVVHHPCSGDFPFHKNYRRMFVSEAVVTCPSTERRAHR